MPAKSERQRRFFGAALARKRAGKSRKGDPKASEETLREFASKPMRKMRSKMRRGGGLRRARSA